MLFGASSRPTPASPFPGRHQGGGCQGGAGGCGQLGARWTGHRKSWVLHTPAPPHVHAHTDVPVCAEVFTLVRRCGSKCLCQMHRHLCACVYHKRMSRYRRNSANPALSFLPPPQLVWLAGGAELARGAPTHPLLGQCQLELSIQDLSAAATSHLKMCQWASGPQFALRVVQINWEPFLP